MFDIAPTELLLVAVVALIVIGPKDLPRALRVVGQWVGRARGVARHFRSGLDEMVRQAELEEMEKKWKAENERIMREYPMHSADVVDDAVDTAPPPSGGSPALTAQPVLMEGPKPASAMPRPSDPELPFDTPATPHDRPAGDPGRP